MIQRESAELYKRSIDQTLELAERRQVLFPSATYQQIFPGARDFAQAICDMAEIEGQLE